MEQKQRERNISALEWFDSIITALAFVLVILVFFLRTSRVDGRSMNPTLQSGDRVIARSLFYKPDRGDIVIVDGMTNFGSSLVKRVIGVEGDTIDIDFDKGIVYLNGVSLEEDYIAAPTNLSFDIEFPVTVPEGKLFLLGDNRPNSEDSRSSLIGMIDERDVLGKVIFRIYPFDEFGGVQ